jgi:serine dehydrogenase proteinase
MANGAPQPKPPQMATAPVSDPAPGKQVKVITPKAASAVKTGAAKKKKAPKGYSASCFPPNNVALPQEFVGAVRRVEAILKVPVWLLIQDPPGDDQSILSQAPPFHTLDNFVLRAFLMSKTAFQKGTKPVIIMESPGGQAESAYRIACFLRQYCGGFLAVVPAYAKSAATLLVLGADQILLCPNAELGPLDVQIFDANREDLGSALNEVQALERLNAFALKAVDEGMTLFASRSGKSLEKLMPQVLHFVAEMTKPLFEKIDTVHYTQMSRLLKIAEEYAIRLLAPRYPLKKAEEIARQLVNGYPEHGFFINREEASRIGLRTSAPKDDLESALEKLSVASRGLVVVGQLQEIKA